MENSCSSLYKQTAKKWRYYKNLCDLDITYNLDVPNPSNYFREEKNHSLSAITEHSGKHPSVSNIKKKNFQSIFFFKKITPEGEVKVIRNLNIRKSCLTTHVSRKVIKLNSDILAKLIYKHLNHCINKGE